jgi:hypothetical protein
MPTDHGLVTRGKTLVKLDVEPVPLIAVVPSVNPEQVPLLMAAVPTSMPPAVPGRAV